ncbi:Glutamyl-tRNA(Gln) synthetase [Candidatus Phaeomarinobacter ectocarpi]|uniref:Glutamate--tRNA ligase n=1 Tax=Candidatus Phaeomarinibacter ectocarpi TaxID=1458461 RepID=X5MGT6_9HYPH|nr:glutamate--tRNA ligase [Candidatus Phaeomarinobacter ectocarpi]CDO60764.1 Glutamyl-tRNA(Gln) synthetase [Candidatus Phaeomarinobacter ectocarpi]
MPSNVKTRFAPSPTGTLHVGNMRAALLNWLYTRKMGGEIVLRFDDTDTARSTRAFADAIEADLAWGGLTFDVITRQSDHIATYDAAADKLKADGLLYPCYETPAELDRRRKRQLSQGKPPVYDRAALELTDEDRAKLEADGRTPHWRFRLSGTKVMWNDLIRGPQSIETASVSDPVLIREDGTYTYMLPSSVDDAEMGITHVLRGEDHVTNTAAQIELLQAVGAQLPAFAHFPLMVAPGGAKLSKREGGASVRDVRERGLEPGALTSYLAHLGTSDDVKAASLDDLIEGFEFSKFGRAPAHYDVADLGRLNTDLLHTAELADVATRLDALGLTISETLWLAIRGNLEKLSDAAIWVQVTDGEITPIIEDADFATKAAAVLPATPWDETTWNTWTDAVKAETGAKGKGLFMPLRKALTGLDHGPELKALLPLIGRDKVLARLGAGTD